MISKTAIIYSNVELGKNVIVEDFCILGCPVRHNQDSLDKTIIGDNSYIRSHTVIYQGAMIGNNFVTGNKANIREKVLIGDNVSIGTLSVVEHSVKIENDVRIHSQAFIPEYTFIGKKSWIGPNVVITNSRYPNTKNSKQELEGVKILENSKIGANSTILPGVIIGKNSLVGAGSVVTKNIEENSISYGSPAFKKSNVKLKGYE